MTKIIDCNSNEFKSLNITIIGIYKMQRTYYFNYIKKLYREPIFEMRNKGQSEKENILSPFKIFAP